MRPKWMVEDDMTILEFMRDHPTPTTAQILAFELDDIKHPQLKKRLRVLRDHGMVAAPEHTPEGLSARGVYEITEFGRRYLSGDITIQEFREMDPTEDA